MLEDYVTLDRGNFAEIAHIIPVSDDWARGNEDYPEKYINDVENLMLLCSVHHDLIDKVSPEKFPASRLRALKQQHEDAVQLFMQNRDFRKSTVITLLYPVGERSVETKDSELIKAMFPDFFPSSRDFVRLLTTRTPVDYFDWGSEQNRLIKEWRNAKLTLDNADHFSVFGLAPMPLLMVLGLLIGDTSDVEVFNKKRDGGWGWPDVDEPVVLYELNELVSSDSESVVLLLNLSGRNDISSLPDDLQDIACYELFAPDVGLYHMKSRAQLKEFAKAYRVALDNIKSKHGSTVQINLLPAIPPSAAIVCGQKLLPKVETVVVYDRDDMHGGWVKTISLTPIQDG